MFVGGGDMGPGAHVASRSSGMSTGAIIRDLLMAALIGVVGWSATEFNGMRVTLVEVKTTMRNYDALERTVESHEKEIAVLRSRMDAYHGSSRGAQ